jgi:FkbM family methyltransferase
MLVIKGQNFKHYINHTGIEPLFIIEDSEDWIEQTIIKEGNWDTTNIKIAKYFIKPNCTILDLGSNLGSFTVTLSKLYKSCNFISVEPQKHKYIQLCANLYINNIKNVSPYNYALTDNLNENYLTMCIAKNNNNGASRLKCEDEATKGQTDISHEEKVKAITLDNLDLEIKGEVTLIKIDVEGHELNVLIGGINIIKKYYPSIIFESWDHCIHKKPQLFNFLYENNYNIFKIKHSEYLAIHQSKMNEFNYIEKMYEKCLYKIF